MDQTHCARVKALLTDAPDRGTTLPSELASHAAACDVCGLELAAAGRLVSLIAAVGDHIQPSSTAEQLTARAVLAAAPGETERASARPWLWGAVGALAAAGVALVLADAGSSDAPGTPDESALQARGAGGLTDEPGGSGGPATAAAGRAPSPTQPLRIVRCHLLALGEEAPCAVTDHTVRTGAAERARLQLSDGTMVTLNHGSELQLGDGPRSVRLEGGEAFFDVVRQAGLEPLTVALPRGHVEVIGTKLTIKARPKMSVVGVLTGEVKVHNGGGVQPVTAGQQAVVLEEEPPVLGPAPNLGVATDWATDRPVGGLVEDGAAVTGFGALKARKPGARKDAPERSLRLAEHAVKVTVQGLVARTEVTEVFANDTGTTLEGIYSFPLPPGAQIAALDLEVEGKWEHGAIVDRVRGDKIWRGVIRNALPKKKRRVVREEWIWVPGPWRDPALMQWKQGNRFELRIFPIPGNGSRRVRIAYTQKLQRVPGGRRYVLPLAPHPSGQARSDRFDAEVRVGGGKVAEDVRFGGYEMARTEASGRVVGRFAARDFKPTGSLVVDIADTAREATSELSHVSFQDPTDLTANYAMLTLRPNLPSLTAGDAAIQAVLVVDHSYSAQAARIARAAELVEGTVLRLGPTAQVQVLACATRCAPVVGGTWSQATSQTAKSLARAVAALEPMGASRLDAVFEAAAARFDEGSEARRRVIFIGDGVPSIGEVEPARLSEAAKESLGAARLTTVSLGGEVDTAMLTALAEAGSGAYVAHGPGATMASTAWEVAMRQRQVPLRGFELELPAGVRQVVGAPALIWPGQEVLVAARLDGPVSGQAVLKGTLEGEPWRREYYLELRPSPHGGNAFVPRLWAEARIAELQLRDDAAARAQVVALSTRHHVLSRHTSLIVLESPAMARAFKVFDTRPPVDWTGDEDIDVVSEEPTKLSSMGATARKKSRRSGLRDDDAKLAGRPSLRVTRPPTRESKVRSPRLGRLSRRRGRWAKRVWYRTAAVRAAGGISSFDQRRLMQRKNALQGRPNSRDRTRALVRWHVRLGDLQAARTLADAWLARDRMDIEALTELAGIAALEGKLARSEELLASALDVDRTAAPAHDRMHALYLASGDTGLACAQARARALLLTGPTPRQVAEAARCGGADERPRFMERLAKRRDRDKADKLLARADGSPRVRGKIKLQATWQGGGQVDLLVVTPSGRVVSWQGGDRRTTSALSQSTGAEELGVRGRELGRYRIYAVRRGGEGPAVNGSVRVKSYGSARRAAFELRPGERARLFDVRIERKSRMKFFNRHL